MGGGRRRIAEGRTHFENADILLVFSIEKSLGVGRLHGGTEFNLGK